MTMRQLIRILEGVDLLPADAMRNPKFRKWFGQSKVVDAQGLPLVVYHGGRAGIKVFGDNCRETIEWAERTGFRLSDVERKIYENPAHFFTDDPYVAEDYADQYEKNHTYEVYLRIERPLDLRPSTSGRDAVSQAISTLLELPFSLNADDDDNITQRRISRVVRGFHHKLKGQSALMGHDGIIMPDTCVRDRSLHTSYVVFNSNQIKTISNSSFSKSNDIHR